MNRLKIILTAVGAFLVAMAGALMFRSKPDKWQETAVDNEEDDIQSDLLRAEVANQEAAKHDAAAHEIKADAERPKDAETTNNILSRWRRS